MIRAHRQGVVPPGESLRLARRAARQGRLGAGIDLARSALAIAPDRAEGWELLGIMLGRAGRRQEAAAAFREVLRRAPESVPSHVGLAEILLENSHPSRALDHVQKAARLRREDPSILELEARCHEASGSMSAAKACLERCILLDPSAARFRSALAGVLVRQNRCEAALSVLREAAAREEENPRIRLMLAATLRLAGDLDRALQAVEQVVQRWDSPKGHVERAEILFLQGRYQSARSDWRHRLELPAMAATRRRFRNYAARPWDGSVFTGRTLLLGIEQGAGDIFQFVRFAKLAKARGGRVLMETRPDQRRLLQQAAGVDALGDRGCPEEPVDLFSPLLNLPALFNLSRKEVSAETPYLVPPGDLVQSWKKRLPARRGRLVGLVWAGNPGNPSDHRRSIPLEILQPLAGLPGVNYLSLQRGSAAAAVHTDSGKALGLLTLEGLRDFADLAAAIACVDLFISVDTAAAHIAGAQGVPVWTLLPSTPEWRWGMKGGSSAWYP
ncbi:MAG: tetratricopeptide repeat protein, partial [Acidobacteriota bacterium]